MILTEEDIDAWVKEVFDHEVTDPAWHWSEDGPDTSESERTLCLLTSVYSNPWRYLARFSDGQLDQGLHLLTSSACSDASFSFWKQELPFELRSRGLRSIGVLFESLFAARCSRTLTDLNAPNHSALDRVCHMWWDIFPFRGESSGAEDVQTCLSIMQRCLASESKTLQYSGLHGLGHWYWHFPGSTLPIVDEYVRANPQLEPELVEYASRARDGRVL
jgi:hypothetical protein